MGGSGPRDREVPRTPGTGERMVLAGGCRDAGRVCVGAVGRSGVGMVVCLCVEGVLCRLVRPHMLHSL
jgi:hypothetical protein